MWELCGSRIRGLKKGFISKKLKVKRLRCKKVRPVELCLDANAVLRDIHWVLLVRPLKYLAKLFNCLHYKPLHFQGVNSISNSNLSKVLVLLLRTESVTQHNQFWNLKLDQKTSLKEMTPNNSIPNRQHHSLKSQAHSMPLNSRRPKPSSLIFPSWPPSFLRPHHYYPSFTNSRPTTRTIF